MKDLSIIKETMSSIEIAELTEKPHSDVLKAIRAMESAWIKVNGGNFSLVEYTDRKGEKRPMYELSKIECLYIATKFNDEARAKLVIRWEQLETEKQRPLSQLEILAQSAQFLLEQEYKMKQLENEVSELRQRTTVDLKRSTVVAYVNRNNISLDVKRFGAIGNKCSRLCKKRSIEPSKVNDPRWGSVKVYPDEILDEVFESEKERKEK